MEENKEIKKSEEKIAKAEKKERQIVEQEAKATNETIQEREEKIAETIEKQEEIIDKEKEKLEDKIEEKKKPEIKRQKKNEAVVRGFSLPISTKHSIALCNFIRTKTTEQALKDLDLVLKMRRPLPMKGEIPHRHGKIMSGRFPQNATEYFVKLIKTLEANARVNGFGENIKITLASANIASRPYGRFGRHRKKRTNVVLITKIQEGKMEKKKMEIHK